VLEAVDGAGERGSAFPGLERQERWGHRGHGGDTEVGEGEILPVGFRWLRDVFGEWILRGR